MAAFNRLAAGALFVFVPESLVGLDGREPQPQYQAPLSLTTDWLDRGGGCYMPPPLPLLLPVLLSFFLLEGPPFLVPATTLESNG